MSYREISYSNEAEWHNLRKKGIGGSDCSIVLGSNPYDDDIVKLWRIKTGRGIDMRPEERAKWLKQISLIKEITEELKKLNDNKGE